MKYIAIFNMIISAVLPKPPKKVSPLSVTTEVAVVRAGGSTNPPAQLTLLSPIQITLVKKAKTFEAVMGRTIKSTFFEN